MPSCLWYLSLRYSALQTAFQLFLQFSACSSGQHHTMKFNSLWTSNTKNDEIQLKMYSIDCCMLPLHGVSTVAMSVLVLAPTCAPPANESLHRCTFTFAEAYICVCVCVCVCFNMRWKPLLPVGCPIKRTRLLCRAARAPWHWAQQQKFPKPRSGYIECIQSRHTTKSLTFCADQRASQLCVRLGCDTCPGHTLLDWRWSSRAALRARPCRPECWPAVRPSSPSTLLWCAQYH